MIQLILIKRLEDALKALGSAPRLVEMLTALNAIHQQIDTCLKGVAEGGTNRIIENANSMYSIISSLPSITKDLSVRKLFIEVEALKLKLSEALIDGAIETKHIVEFLEVLDDFAETYSTYIGHQIGVNAFSLLLVARRLRLVFADLYDCLEYVRVNLSGLVNCREGEAEFSLVLTNVIDVKIFSEKLAALNALYLEICYLLGVSVPSHPLRIGKIESGSLWTKLFGDTRAVGLMISLIEGGIHFFHRNYTKEGKIAAIPKKLESLNEMLDFSNRLKESGCDVAEIEEKIAKGAAIITDNLNILLSDQPVVELNGKNLSIGQELQKALLEQIAIQKIGYAPSADPVPKLKLPDQT